MAKISLTIDADDVADFLETLQAMPAGVSLATVQEFTATPVDPGDVIEEPEHKPIVSEEPVSDNPIDEQVAAAADLPEFDSTGLQYDERIHATPASLTTKGVWRKKRGVTNEEFDEIAAQLRTPASEAEQAALDPGTFDAAAQAAGDVAPTPSTLPPMPQTDEPAPEPGTIDVSSEDIFAAVAQAMGGEKPKPNTFIKEICDKCEIAQLAEITNDADALGRVALFLREQGVL